MDVDVVRTDRGDVLRSQTIVVRDGRIVQIGPVESVAVPREADTVFAGGGYLIPGMTLLDAYLPTSDDDNRNNVLLMYLARGVTTVRAPVTHPSQPDLARRVNGGNPTGPRIILVERSVAEMSAEERPRLRTDVPRADAGASPAEALRALTVDAAHTLGLDHEIGTISVGSRADLVLLSGDPLESSANLAQVIGVMVNGRWVRSEDLRERMEDRARDLVEGYYVTIPRRGFSIPGCGGETLQECFGGDSDCGIALQCTSMSLPARRMEMLDEMELLGAIAPQSDWIVGQRVNFALKNGDLERASLAADSCSAALWWCQALRGYVRHERSKGSGEAQLDSAWANAPPGTPAWALPRFPSTGDRGLHCEWRDLSTLLSGAMLAQHRRLGCGFEGALEKRFWWLSDPLWSVPGNERRSEHVVRNIQMKLHDQILRVRRGSHPQEHHVVVIPEGVPNSWQPTMRLVGRAGAGGPNLAEGRQGYVNGGYAFTPAEAQFLDPVHTTTEDWAVEWNKGRFVRTEALPPPAAPVQLEDRMLTSERWYTLEHQTAVLRRDGRLRVLAAARPPQLLASYDDQWAALVMGRPVDLQLALTSAKIGSAGDVRASIDVDAPKPVEAVGYLWSRSDGEWMASLEVIGDGFRARARHGVPAPALVDGFGLSDLVLVDDRMERLQLPVLDAMLASSDLSGRSSVGVYFEVYGVERDEPLQLVLSGERVERSLLARVTDALRLRTGGSIGVEWQEAAQMSAPDRVERHVNVNLGTLTAGTYDLFVTVRRGNGTTATAARVIRVTPPTG